MKNVCVITGGGSGIGFAAAKVFGQQGYYIILVGRTAKKLNNAVSELQMSGVEAEAFSCDISDRASTQLLAAAALERGEVKVVIHAAGMSPQMGDAQEIMKANALGTVNVNDAFYEVMKSGGCLIDTSSMSAHLTPQFIMPKRNYKWSRIDRDRFMKKMMSRVNLFPKKVRAGVAYGISKNFVIWFYKDGQPFNNNHLRPCPLLDNPDALAGMVECSGASSTDLQNPEDARELSAKCRHAAQAWGHTADELWQFAGHCAGCASSGKETKVS